MTQRAAEKLMLQLLRFSERFIKIWLQVLMQFLSFYLFAPLKANKEPRILIIVFCISFFFNLTSAS